MSEFRRLDRLRTIRIEENIKQISKLWVLALQMRKELCLKTDAIIRDLLKRASNHKLTQKPSKSSREHKSNRSVPSAVAIQRKYIQNLCICVKEFYQTIQQMRDLINLTNWDIEMVIEQRKLSGEVTVKHKKKKRRRKARSRRNLYRKTGLYDKKGLLFKIFFY